MLGLKEFLLEECGNVERLLDETLRYAFGPHSRSFYEECNSRLRVITGEVKKTPESTANELQNLGRLLSHLSRLIAQIERSHLREFSWPFAEALRKLAVHVCRDPAIKDPSFDPLFFYSSEGGFVYRIFPDATLPILIRRRIFNVVFPRSLKYTVLLHPILGHEIGHAAQSVPSFRKELEKQVVEVLVKNSVLESPAQLATWLQANYKLAPPPDVIARTVSDWRQELFCDLFGLALFGPSFYCAHLSLMLSLDASGVAVSGSHPPNLSRCWFADLASKSLGWNVAFKDDLIDLREAMNRMSAALDTAVARTPAYLRFLDQKQIHSAATALATILSNRGDTLYKMPEPAILQDALSRLLALTPPFATDLSNPNEPANRRIDFRTILMAGWLTWHHPKRPEGLGFLEINRLCDRAILYDHATAKWLNT